MAREIQPVVRGFTLVEVLIVVVLLAILAGIVVPQISDAGEEARISALLADLQTIRSRLEVYKAEHNDQYPNEDFVLQMTRYTNAQGEVSDTRSTEFRLGPYVLAMPDNPITGDARVRVVNTLRPFTPPVADRGWWFNSVTGEFCPDLTYDHSTPDGQPLSRLTVTSDAESAESAAPAETKPTPTVAPGDTKSTGGGRVRRPPPAKPVR